jgi:hypothetical protein
VAKSIGQFIRAESISRNIKTTIIRHHAPDLSHRRADRMLIFFQVRIRQLAINGCPTSGSVPNTQSGSGVRNQSTGFEGFKPSLCKTDTVKHAETPHQQAFRRHDHWTRSPTITPSLP